MSDAQQTDYERVLTFVLEDSLFALNILSVREILDVTDITRVPQAPAFMRGVVNLRGNAVPVMDLRQRLGMSPTEPTINTRIIIMEVKEDNAITLMGALADAVKEVLELPESGIDAPPKMGAKVAVEYIRGIGRQGDRFVILLDIERVLSFSGIKP
jgi:purine-binding chemotaxis protein CheW